MTELISRQAALAAIDKNRDALLSSGMAGAEHILVHYGRRVIEELPSVKPKPSPDWNGWENGCGRTYDVQPKKGKEEWLERLILDNELLGDWFCDEMATSEWCEENCRFAFPQRVCLEKAYELGFFDCGARMERSEE